MEATTSTDNRFDSIARRRRTQPTSTGKRVSPQTRDLLWFSKLHEHGPLPSSFLLEFSQGMCRSEKRAKERLTDLFNENNTPHDGSYLTRPLQQFRTIDSRYNQLVYDLAPAAERALQDEGLWHERQARPSGPWLHQFMVSCITASIELATLARPDLSYIPQHEILARADAVLRHSITITDPATGRRVEKDLIPDALFGLRYRTDDGDRFRFFVVEADRATEPARSGNWRRKSFEGSLLQYREYVGQGGYRDHLNLTAPLLVLYVTSSQKQMERMIALAEELSGPGGNPYTLFRTCEAFGPVFRPPQPMHDLLNSAWRRAAMSDFFVDRP